MSERLSSVEIEDVLSSIRRLVSEDLRPGAKPAEAAAPAPAPAATEVGKLVLTPAHRIQSEPEPASEMSTGGFASVRGRAAQPIYEEDAEVPAAQPSGNPDWFDFAGPAGAEPSSGDVGAPMAEMAEPMDDGVDPVEVAAWSREPVEAPAVSHEPDADAVASDSSAEPGVQGEEVLSGPAAQAEGADWLPEDEPAAALAGEEAAMPDLAGAEPVAATASASRVQRNEDWADAAEAEIRRELEAEAEASVFSRFDAADEVDGVGEPVFDEEMLRDLVRDIIREELQGALGERITRNVRKLVRAEIARALAVRDFE